MKLAETPIFAMWKKHQNLTSNNNNSQSVTKYGFLVGPDAQIVALPEHCTRTALTPPPKGMDQVVGQWEKSRYSRL